MPAERPRGLSKSKLLSWLQCPKRLWLEVHRPQLAAPSDAAHAAFRAGHETGDVARQLYPRGILIGSPDDVGKALADTAARIPEAPPILFEPAFEHDGVVARADILRKRKTGRYQLREVKATTKVKEHHIPDAAIQTWVLRNAGIKLDSVVVQYLDKKFTYQGGGDYRGLFTAKSVDAEIRPLTKDVPKWAAQARATLAAEREPKKQTGKHCHDPYACPCLEYCSGKEPQTKYPVALLPRLRDRQLERLEQHGFRDVRQIPPDFLTSEHQERVRRITRSGKQELLPGAAKAVRALGYPRYHFDFETVRFAVPIWKGTRPYQQIPFQWSCHVERAPGKVEHRGYLDTSSQAPMRAVAESLLEALGRKGPILSHHASFEKQRINELASLVPSRARELRALLSRFIDTEGLTKAYYYHPAMMGSWSLKQIVPTIAPDLDYGNLGEVQDGGEAAEAYLEMIAAETPTDRKAELRSALERYCARDTLALVRLLRFLRSGK